MSDDWLPICSHGDSEEEIRAALDRYLEEAANDLRRDLRAEGWPLESIEKAAAMFVEQSRRNLDIPKIMRDMAISAGEKVH